MNDRDRLATELMGWEHGDDGHDEPWFDKLNYYRCPRADWDPKANDHQAQMVCAAVAKLGYRWEITTWWPGFAGNVMHDVRLFRTMDNELILGAFPVSDRNAHIVKAAIAALDAMKPAEPKPHRCDGMDNEALWRLVEEGGTRWDFYNYADRRLVGGAEFCHFCGHDLNKPDGSDG